MKKLIAVIATLFMVVGFASMATAANLVEVKTNSEGVTGAEDACEKAGNITFIFDAGTVLRDGDWWTADLPLGVTLCSNFDFVVTGVGAPAPGLGGFAGTIAAPSDGGTLDNKIWAVNDIGNIAGAQGVTVVGNAMFFRVRGAAGSNRLRIDVYDSDADGLGAGGVNNAQNYNGSSTFTVDADVSFQLKLFDGFNGLVSVGNRFAFNDTPTGTPAVINGVYGDAVPPADFLQNSNDTDNTYCIQADTTVFSGSTVNVSINSGGFSGNNFLTFNPANPQVAHLISAATITLEACKGEEMGFHPIEGGQAANCQFDYNANANEFCLPFVGNDFILTNQSGTFFDAGDDYRVRLLISGNGAYWGGTPTGIDGYMPSEIACEGGGAAITPGWTVTTETGAPASITPRSAACGSFDADEEWTTLSSTSFTGIDTFNELDVDIPSVVYDPDVVVAGDQVTVTIELWRLPCGLIFSDERVIAEFVDTCAAAVPTTTLYYPYMVALDGSQGWWFGYVIGNPTTEAGTATITLVEMDGDIGTYTTPEIAALGLHVLTGGQLLALLTPDAANVGTLGDTQAHMIVVCEFGSAGGFAMQGNNLDSTGYTPHARPGSGVGPWVY